MTEDDRTDLFLEFIYKVRFRAMTCYAMFRPINNGCFLSEESLDLVVATFHEFSDFSGADPKKISEKATTVKHDCHVNTCLKAEDMARKKNKQKTSRKPKRK